MRRYLPFHLPHRHRLVMMVEFHLEVHLTGPAMEVVVILPTAAQVSPVKVHFGWVSVDALIDPANLLLCNLPSRIVFRPRYQTILQCQPITFQIVSSLHFR
jgi:hypothetical protein